MSVPEEYKPVLPDKVKAYIKKKQADAEAGSKAQVIYYECIDDGCYWAEGGHKSHKQNGAVRALDLLSDPENENALMVSYRDNRLYLVRDGAMVPTS